jgi:hypothetical protein
MLDIFLNWFVIAIPFLVAVGATVLALRLPHERHYWKFVWGAIVVGLLFSALAYWQQVRAAHQAEASQREAIEKTAKTVAKETTDNVTEAVGKQYQTLVSSLTSQNQSLAMQLAAQGKDVSTIKSSNIVTGKKPLKVEVTNPAAPPVSAGAPPLPNLSWTQESGQQREGKPVTVVRFRVDDFINFPAFIALCDRPCVAISGGAVGMSQATLLRASNPNVAGVVFSIPRPFPPSTPAQLQLASEDTQPIKVNSFRILRESELPPEFK